MRSEVAIIAIIVRLLKYLGLQYIGVVFSSIGLLSFWFLDDLERNTNISVAIKSGSTRLFLFEYK